ncbi:PilW family protein [Thermodesulfobacteriota bacterium]
MLPVSKNKKRGFSLVELIIALAITSIALIAVYNLFITQQRSFLLQEEVSNMQQNNRVAMENLSEVVKMAGSGVLTPQQKILYCGPFDFVFSGDFNGIAGDAMATGTVIGNTLYTAPSTAAFVNLNSETYRWTLDKNDDGVLTTSDLSNTTAGAAQYSLWKMTYTGAQPPLLAEVTPNIATQDINNNQIVLFQYWGNFDADNDIDLFGDSDESGDLDAAEIAALGPVAVAGKTLDDILQMVDIKVITETHKKDPNYPGNAAHDGFRQVANSSAVTPRNLWACNTIETVPGYQSTLMVTGDSTFSYSKPVTFKVSQGGVPIQGAVIDFTATIGGVDITTQYPSAMSTKRDTSDANGIVSLDISIDNTCNGFFAIGDQILVTAVLPAETTPFGPCAADSDTANIFLIAGIPDHLEATSMPTKITMYTCNEDNQVSTFDIVVHDKCENPVPPVPVVPTFAAFSTIGGICTGNSGFGTVDAVWNTAETATLTYKSPSAASKYVGVDRMGANSDHFLVRIADNFAGGYDCGAPIEFMGTPIMLKLETFANQITDLDSSAITGWPHTDCGGAVATYDAIFSIRDSCDNLVYDLTHLSLGNLANVTGKFTPDTVNGILNAPTDHGFIDAAMADVTLTAAANPAGEYIVTYTDPMCTLPPLFSRVLNLNIQLTTNNFKNASPGPFDIDFTLQSCSNCEINATNPTIPGSPAIMASCLPVNSQADVTTITAVFCGVPDGTPVELEVTDGASFDPNGPQSTYVVPGGYQASTTGAIKVYPGTATNGAVLDITAYSPDKATYATAKDGFMCENIGAIVVKTLCNYIKTYNEPILPTSVESTTVGANENLYIEVDDCNRNMDASTIETITVTVTSPQGYAPPAPDVETVILTETGVDTGVFNSNSYVGAGNDPGPLAIIYCGIGAGGDVSQNGMLFIRIGYDVTVQYTDTTDPADNACVKTLTTRSYSCPAFIYSYFAHSYIHLDRHGLATSLSLGGNIFTNGEFELSGDMYVDCSNDGILGNGDDFAVTSLGHMSIGGTVFGNAFAPSFDLFGPDGEGQNGQTFPPNIGVITGGVFLMNGYTIQPASNPIVYIPEVIGSRGNVPSYGSYTSLAAPGLFQPPPGSSVIINAFDAGAGQAHNSHPDPLVGFGAVYDGAAYDPNTNPQYLLPWELGGRVLLAKDLPEFDYALSITKAQDTTTRYNQALTAANGYPVDTYFTSMAEFDNFIKTEAKIIYTAADTTSYTSGLVTAPGGITTYIIGDHYEGTVFHFTSDFTMSGLTLGANEQLIVNGMIVTETLFSTKGATYAGLAIYACGYRPVEWRKGWTGDVYTKYIDWETVRGGFETIPYDLVAIVAKTKLEVKDGTAHVVIKGIAYCESESHFHNKVPEGRAFLHGAQIADVVHNCLYMDFEYNDCVRRAAADWYGCYCDTGGAAVACSVSITPSVKTLVKGGIESVLLSATGGQGAPATYTWSRTGSSGGTIVPDPSDSSKAIYTAGVIGADTVSAANAACISGQATIDVTGACAVEIDPALANVYIGDSKTFSVKAGTGNGPTYTWVLTVNNSGATIVPNLDGTQVVYTAGIGAGPDTLTLIDDGGCAQDSTIITINTCRVVTQAREYNAVGGSCTATVTNVVDVNGTLCLVATITDDPVIWTSTDPDGRFYDTSLAVPAWVLSATTVMGQDILYRAGPTLGTYDLNAEDTEGCTGTEIISTCGGGTVDTTDPTITEMYVTDTVEFTGNAGPRSIVSWTATDGAMFIPIPADPTKADFSPSGIPALPYISTITAIDDKGCQMSTTIKVIACPALTVTPPATKTILYYTGNTETFTAVGGTAPYSWTTSDNNIGKFSDPLISVMTPIAVYPAFPQAPVSITITAIDDVGCSGTTFATVTCPTISVSPANQSVALLIGKTYVYKADDLVSADGYDWTSSNTSVATVAGNYMGDPKQALVTIAGGGTAAIRATSQFAGGQCYGETNFTVNCPAVVTITPNQVNVEVGKTVIFSASGGTGPYTWTVDDPLLGTITQLNATQAMFEAVKVGTVNVTSYDATNCDGALAFPIVTACSATLGLDRFEAKGKNGGEIRIAITTTDKAATGNSLTFEIFTDATLTTSAFGPDTLAWDGSSLYEYRQNGLGAFVCTWNCNYVVRVKSSACPSADATFTIQQIKNCAGANCP